MDIYCVKCGEPWDNDTIHEEVGERKRDGDKDSSYDSVAAQFRREGCGAFSAIGIRPCKPVRNDTTMIADAIYELLGDDMDGAASEFDHAMQLGLLD